MPSFTFTANAGTDVITTSSPHSRSTGDGPVCVRNVGGALPTGLTALTDMWLIVTGASTAKLATSSANAMSGTAIDITGAGTGTHYLEIGIPYRRARTYVALSQVKSADLDAIQDALVAVHDLFTGQTQGIWSGVTLAGALDVAGLATLATLSAADVALTGPVKLTGIVTPAALSAGNNNNYNPTGLATANVLRVGAASGSPFITGIAGGTSGRVLHIVNVNTDDVVITHEDGSSTAANRFTLPNSTSFVTIRDGGTMTVWYDGTSSRWRPLSQNL